MIFASVGSMLPFDRFVKGVDEWAGKNPDTPVFIQIGDGKYEPRHAPWTRILEHADYRQRLIDCQLFVAHVGMGSILQAMEVRKQMLLLPRSAELREHTTNHQLHTASRFKERQGVRIVEDVEAMHMEMDQLVANPMEASAGIPSFAPEAFTQRITEFLVG